MKTKSKNENLVNNSNQPQEVKLNKPSVESKGRGPPNQKVKRKFLTEECNIPDEVDQNINSLELPDFLKRKKDFVVKNLGW